MNIATVHATRTQSTLMKFPGGRFGYLYPRSTGAAEIVAGVWLVFLGILLLSQANWWAVALLAVAALEFWVARDQLQSRGRS
jgi:hypothetical protein